MMVSSEVWRASQKVQTTLLTGVKHSGQLLAATGVTGLNHSRLFYIIDTCTNIHFLVDTGAEVSIIPPTSTDKNNLCHLTLQTLILGADFLCHYGLLVDMGHKRLIMSKEPSISPTLLPKTVTSLYKHSDSP